MHLEKFRKTIPKLASMSAHFPEAYLKVERAKLRARESERNREIGSNANSDAGGGRALSLI